MIKTIITVILINASQYSVSAKIFTDNKLIAVTNTETDSASIQIGYSGNQY